MTYWSGPPAGPWAWGDDGGHWYSNLMITAFPASFLLVSGAGQSPPGERAGKIAGKHPIALNCESRSGKMAAAGPRPPALPALNICRTASPDQTARFAWVKPTRLSQGVSVIDSGPGVSLAPRQRKHMIIYAWKKHSELPGVEAAG